MTKENFTEIPEHLSETSKIVDVKFEDYRRGIILANMKELETALRVYNGEVIPESKATTHEAYKAAFQDHGPMGVGLFALASEKMRKWDIVGKILKEAKPALQKEGFYRRSFEYDALGSNFFKTYIGIERVEDVYILSIKAAYVGSKPEEELAKYLKKPRALRYSEIGIKMSAVDERWFNIDLESLLKKLYIPMPKEDIRKLAEDIVEWDKPKLIFEYDGEKFQLDVEIDCTEYVRIETPKNGNPDDKEVLVSRGSNIIGLAWDPEKAKPSLPVVILKLRYPSYKSYKSPIVDSERMERLQNVRDYLVQRVRPEK